MNATAPSHFALEETFRGEYDLPVGIAGSAARLLLKDHAENPFGGSVLQLGRQTCAFTRGDLRVWAARAGARLCRETLDRTRGALDDVAFFGALGFDEVVSLDVSSFEGATCIADLNDPLPASLRERFDLVFNGGTLEHVFNVPGALANVHHALRIGGRAVHICPASQQVDHGLYSFSPTLFLDYYSANRYEIAHAYVFEARTWESPWTAYHYGPTEAARVAQHVNRPFGFRGIVGTWFCVRKTLSSTASVVPQQGFYRKLWEEQLGMKAAVKSRPRAVVRKALQSLMSGPAWAPISLAMGARRPRAVRY